MNRCDLCGKFCKVADLVQMEGDSNDGYQGDLWLECKNCMSASDFKTYFPNEGITNEPQSNKVNLQE